MLGFKPPMETIEEQNPESPRSAKSMKMSTEQSLDGVLQAITSPGKKPRPSPVFMDSNVWHGRSRSTSDVPPTRKPSQRVREWMKRSKSTRTFRSVSDSESPEKERILKIDHLGGGRVGGIDADTPITIGLAELAVSMRSPKPRWQAGSPESRVTQWIDLYPEALEAFSPTYSPGEEPGPLTSHDPREPKESQDGENDTKLPEDDDDLHPAPLRCPSVEKELEAIKDRDSSDAKATDSTKAKPDTNTPQATPDAKPKDGPRWKPLPNLPHGPSPSITETASPSIVVKKVKKPQAQSRDDPSPTVNETRTNTKLDTKKKPEPQTQPAPLGTPPPTPDSARATSIPDKPRIQPRDSADSKASKSSAQSTPPTPASTPASSSIPIPIPALAPVPVPVPTPEAEEAKPHTVHTFQHTRRERVWLHANYRGEAPFLQAWGLDIKVPGDREVGLEILRDLMLAEEEGGNSFSSSTSLSGEGGKGGGVEGRRKRGAEKQQGMEWWRQGN